MRRPNASAGRARISVLLANDQRILRDGLRAILERERDLRVVASASDGSEVLHEIDRHRPQAAVLDIAMAGLNGIEATRIIAQRGPPVGVLILSEHSTPAMVQRAFEAGARGYLSRNCAGDDLVRGIRAVAAGERYLSQGLAERALVPHRGAGRQAAVERLTSTEREILRLVAEGRSNTAAADFLGLSPRTVETYRARLMRKLGLENLPSLVRYAIRHGITPLD